MEREVITGHPTGWKDIHLDIDTWTSGYKVRCFPWVDGKRIYLNVQYYAPGQSLSQPPKWDRSVYIVDSDKARRMIWLFLDSMVNYVATMPPECFGDGKEVQIELESVPLSL